MKHLFGVFVLSLLVGCSSTKSINGEYDVDIEYKARGTANAIESVGHQLPIPKEEYIQRYLEDIKTHQYEATVEYPYLVVTINAPDKEEKVVRFKLQETDNNRYSVTRESINGEPETDPEKVKFELTYNPVDKSLSSETARYIKR